MVLESALLTDLGIIVLVGTLFAFVFKKLNQPLLVGYIFAGVLVGPVALGLINDVTNISALAELGVAFLLFALGMEIDFSKLMEFKKTLVLGGLGQIVLNTALVAALTHFLGFSLIEAIYAGFIVSFSSTVIVVKILSESKQLNSLEGKLIIGYALVQDLVAVLILPVLAQANALTNFSLLTGILASILVLLGLGFAISRWVFPRLVRFAARSPEIFYLTVLSSFFFFTGLSQLLNFSLAAGAFIGGLALSQTAFSTEALTIIRNIRDLFATVFFVSLGMQLTSFPATASLGIFLVMLGVIFILNPLIFSVVNLSAGFGLRASLFVGLALAQASEFSFVLASQGLKLGQISPATYNLAIWTIIVSMVATPYMIKYSDRLHAFLRKNVFPKKIDFFQRRLLALERLPKSHELQNHVIVAGAGVFGSELANELSGTQTVVVVDQDPRVVQRFIQNGFFAAYASRANQQVWEKICLEKARLLIVSIPDNKSAAQLSQLARQNNPEIVIVGRAHYYHEAAALYENGADFVILPQVVGSNLALQTIQDFLQNNKKPKPSPLTDEYLRVLNEKAMQEKNGY